MGIFGTWIKQIMGVLNPDSSSAWDEYRRARCLQEEEMEEERYSRR